MKIKILLSLAIFFSSNLFAQKIPPYYFSQNAWMSDTLGNIDACGGTKWDINCRLYGKIHKGDTWRKVKASGVRLVRFGGEHADENKPTNEQYLRMIDSIRANGMEPLLQIPYNNNYYTVDTAIEILKYINITMKRNVKYWSIGNEPDLAPPYGYGYYTASPIADYIKQFSSRMKEIDSSIFTLGPELKFYDDNHRLVSELTTPGGHYDITGRVPGHTYHYIDVFTFHTYPFGGEQKREQIVSNLRDPWHISNMLDRLNAKLDSCNVFHERTDQPLKIGLTETNLNYRNSPDGELNAHSFIAGQFWCELMNVGLEKGVEFISFWSVIERSLGYIDEESGKLWPTYHHYSMMSQNFKGNYCKSLVSEEGKFLKVGASMDSSRIHVMVMNQKNEGKGYRYSIQLGSGKVEGGVGVKIRITGTESLTLNSIYTDSIQDESTCLLTFNHQGELIQKLEYKKSDSKPLLIKKTEKPLTVSAGSDINSSHNAEVVLGKPMNLKNAKCEWYEGNSAIPILSSGSGILKVKVDKNTSYRLVVNYQGCLIEDCVNVTVH
ncbi:MAG: hypothetical protein M3R27_10645 [Bacteroidota bacterium]|nr:hypothetical protein [Bacteroidota bacterium]